MGADISFKWFVILLAASAFIAIGYLLGHRKNLKIIRRVASVIESEILPSDTVYTWLGGVLGFTATYALEGFSKLTASFFTLPRQSLLYLPIAYLTTTHDKLELFFYLKKNISNEIHIIKKNSMPGRMPTIYNKDNLVSETININGSNYLVLYRKQDKMIKKLTELLTVIDKKSFFHIALTPDKNIFYIRLNIKYGRLNSTGSSIKEIKKFLLSI